MPALVVIPVGDSFQHPDLRARCPGASVRELAAYLDGLDEADRNALTPAESFHSWPSLKAAVANERLPCCFLLVGTEQADDTGLEHDRARDSRFLFGAVRRFLNREFGEVTIEQVVAHPHAGRRQLHEGLIRHERLLSHATTVYIMGGATQQVRGHLASLLPALVHSGCPVVQPVANREAHHHWETLRAVDADQVPLVALALRALENDLAHLAQAVLSELVSSPSPDWSADDAAAFQAAMQAPPGGEQRRALIEAWSWPD